VRKMGEQLLRLNKQLLLTKKIKVRKEAYCTKIFDIHTFVIICNTKIK